MDMEAQPLVKRIPKDAFEVELFRKLIQSEIDEWGGRGNYFLVGGPNEHGEWTLHVSKPPEEMDIITGQFVQGKIWVAEREYPVSEHYRVVVEWRVGDQQNASPYPPVLDWD